MQDAACGSTGGEGRTPDKLEVSVRVPIWRVSANETVIKLIMAMTAKDALEDAVNKHGMDAKTVDQIKKYSYVDVA